MTNFIGNTFPALYSIEKGPTSSVQADLKP